ncbi:disease resistance protein Roq1 isoform X2 [Arachis hypogaea]|uniref:disease resistance protein Roq1 isoform X2 n=1 Tax=Arachis hypogaea TaxID=3818 RepID=UPI000DECFEC2
MPLQSSFSSFSTHSSSSSSYGYAWEYDVFISFRGEDTRYGFTGNLYKALFDKGVHTFIDDEELQRGDEITPSLLKAIEESRIAIIVLSPNYASSSFCLDELVHILHCIKGNNRLVLPVFYEADPSDVRHQRNSFGEAMAKHEEKFKSDLNKVHKWKQALHQVANLSGYHFKHGDGYEHKFIRNIVEEISRKIRRLPLFVARFPVGLDSLDSRVSKVISLLRMNSSDQVHMVGIHGVGGIGKTALACAVHNLIVDHFDGTCFLANVRENSKRHGLAYLQNILLSEILGKEEIKIVSVQQGTTQIQRRLCQKKVLLILDDVDDHKQLQAMAGKPNWFGLGSRVIITTRDTHLLKYHGVENTHEVEGLNEAESSQLLVKHAFKNGYVSSPSYADVLTRTITYASGLPLALEVIGSHLCGKKVEEWESALNKFERHLDDKIHEIFQVSFDALGKEEQSVFLDIACCFKGYKTKELTDILQAHYGSCMKYHIGVLVEKSLMKINQYDNNVTMHDLIESMGKEIALKESPEMPGKRSRLWFYEDIVKVLQDNLMLISLKVLKFDYSDSLKKIPDVSNLQLLEEFSCVRCSNLVSVDSSVGFLPKLKILNAAFCFKLRSFPPVINLASLEELVLFGCSSLEKFPEILEEMENLKALYLWGTGIKDLPCSFCNLSRLRRLTLNANEMYRIPSVIGMMPRLFLCDIELGGNKGRVSGEQEEGLHGILTHSLPSADMRRLSITNSNLSDDFFPLAVAWFPNVISLVLGGNNFTVLPECIQQFRFLKELLVNDCKHLREIRGIPPNLEFFSAVNCKSLSERGTSVLLNQQVHQGRSTHFVMPGGSIPRWFERRSSGACISFWFRGTKFPYNALCFAILLKDDFPSPLELRPIVTINGNLGSYRFERAMDQLFIFNLNSDPYYEALHLERGWNHAKLSYEAYKNYEDHKEKVPSESIGKEIGMHVWKEESSSIMEDIRFTDPYKMTQLIIMMIMLSIAFPNHKNHPLLLDTCIGLWMLLFLTHTLSGY